MINDTKQTPLTLLAAAIIHDLLALVIRYASTMFAVITHVSISAYGPRCLIYLAYKFGERSLESTHTYTSVPVPLSSAQFRTFPLERFQFPGSNGGTPHCETGANSRQPSEL